MAFARALCAIIAMSMAAVGCAHLRETAPSARTDAPFNGGGEIGSVAHEDLSDVLRADPELAPFVDDAARRRMQILIAVPEDAGKTLRRYSFRADAEYFYPASAVKLCVASAALEKLAELRAGKPELAVSTPLRISFGGDRPRVVDTTLQSEIEKALVLSDNDASNRLFEFVGPEELAWRLDGLGLRSARIVHRLGDSSDPVEPAFELRGSGPPVSVARRVGVEILPARSEPVGSAHIDEEGRLVDAPFDFGEKNRISLAELQDFLVAVVRPELSDLGPFRWSPDDRDAMLAWLGRLPSELPGRPPRSLDARLKPLHVAVTAALPDDDVRVYGKGGRAYGFTVESSYIHDATTQRGVFVTATIYANDNETINDDRYEYAEVADPFIAALGRFVARTYLRQAR